MPNECHCCHENNSSSASFVFGLVIGAIAGAIIAIILYRNNKNEVINSLKERLETFFRSLYTEQIEAGSQVKRTPKTPVSSLIAVETENQVKSRKTAPRVFIRARK